MAAPQTQANWWCFHCKEMTLHKVMVLGQPWYCTLCGHRSSSAPNDGYVAYRTKPLIEQTRGTPHMEHNSFNIQLADL